MRVAALSATVSNAEEFGDWLGTVRGATDVVVSEHRPVPLWQHVMVGNNMTQGRQRKKTKAKKKKKLEKNKKK